MKNLSERIPEQAFHTWFDGIAYKDYSEGSLIVEFADEFALDWVKKHYFKLLISIAQQIYPGFETLSLIHNQSAQSVISAVDTQSENELKFFSNQVGVAETLKDKSDLIESISRPAGLVENYRFDNFMGQGGFHMAYTISKEVACFPGQKALNPLIIHGETGLGKTHLATAIGNFCLENHTAKRIIFKTSEQFLSEFVGKIRNEAKRRSTTGYKTITDREVMGMSKEILNADLLIIDDIQFLAGKEKTQDHFCKILNSLMAMNKQVVVTCDKSPDSFRTVMGKKIKESLDERLLHKFRSGTAIEVSNLDIETRELLLRRKIQDFRLAGYIPEPVIHLLSEVPLSNVRELEGVLNKLFAYKELMRKDITVDMVRIILGDLCRNINCTITIDKIIAEVSSAMGITKEMIVSMSRIQKAALPRKIAMYLCRELTDNSLHTIGLQFNRDYSTVIFNIKAFVVLLKRDPELSKKVREIKEKLAQSF